MIRSLLVALLLAIAMPSSGEELGTMGSILLVARRDLPDPFFRDSVVLVTNNAGGAPVGVIINRPTDVPLTKLFPDIERLRVGADKVFFGGPVRRQELVFLFRAAKPPEDAIEVLDGIYLSSSLEVLRDLLGREKPADGLRVFAGYAGWAPGQLEGEIARGDWHLVRADAATLFAKKPETLWQELERRASAVVAGLQ